MGIMVYSSLRVKQDLYHQPYFSEDCRGGYPPEQPAARTPTEFRLPGGSWDVTFPAGPSPFIVI